MTLPLPVSGEHGWAAKLNAAIEGKADLIDGRVDLDQLPIYLDEDQLNLTFAGATKNGGPAIGRGELIFNVMDDQFGAVGDGGTNDQVAFTTAITAAKAASAIGPSVVWAPWTPKGYRWDNGISTVSRVTLRGERRVRIRRTGTGSSFFVNSNGARGWNVEGFTFDDSLGLTASSMIRAGTGTRDYAIRNNKFVGSALGVSHAIITKQLTGNVATITVDEVHGLEVGSIVHISQVDSTFDGDYTVTAVPTTTSVQFALTASDVASTAVYDGWLNGETRRTVVSKACSANVVTLETSVAHGYTVGQFVYVTGVEGENDGGADITMNGNVEILSVPDATHFTYTKTHADQATTASGGTVGIATLNATGFLANAIDHQNGVVGGVIEDNWFEGLGNNIRIPDTQRLTCQRNLFTNWTTRCFYIVGQATSATEDLALVLNRIKDMHIGGEIRQAIAIQGNNDTYLHKRILITLNTVIGVNKAWTAPDPGGADQISLQRCEDFRVVGNYSGFGGDLGINVSAQCRRGVIAANVCEHNDTAGINLGAQGSTSADYVNINGNTLVNNGQARNADRGYQTAISLAGFAHHILIDGNLIADDQVTPTTLIGVHMRDSSDIEFGVNLFTNIATKYHIDEGCSDIRGIPVGTVTLSTPPNEAGHNSTAETIMWAADLIDPALLAVGQVYRMKIRGTMDFIASPGAFNLHIKVGGVTTLSGSLVSSTTTTAATGLVWAAEAEFIIEALGATGAVSSMATVQTVSGNTNTRNQQFPKDIGGAQDLSAGLDISVGANTGTADAGNIVRVDRATLTKVTDPI